MDSILDVKEELVARARTESLDELKSKGRTQVRVIRAEHIAAMVREAVGRAVGDAGMISREEVDALVDRSQAEFRGMLQEREEQLARSRDAMLELENVKEDRVRLEASLQEVTEQRDALEQQLADAQSRLAAFESGAGQSAAGHAAAAEPAAPAGAELMLKLMNEVAELKANMHAQPAAPAAAEGGADVSAAIDKLAGSLNERLEKFGRKMGISSAVDSQDVKFDGLFEKEGGGELESNMDTVQVKKKTEGGIHANLERLRKLKGNG